MAPKKLKLFKAVNKDQYEKGKILDTTTFNYGSIVEFTERDATRFDDIIETSKKTGEKLEELVNDAVRRCAFDERQKQKLSAQFWEFLYDKVRLEVAPAAPSRLASMFACEDLPSVARFLELAPRDAVCCELEILNLTVCFKADMLLTEMATGDLPTENVLGLTADYWQGKISAKPLYELFVQGRFKVGPPILIASADGRVAFA